MNPLYGTIDLGAFFGAERRVLDGEEHIVIPLRFNPSIVNINGSPTAMLRLRPMPTPDQDGYTHSAIPHIPKSRQLTPADFAKATRPIGRFKEQLPPGQQIQQPDPTSGIDYTTFASNPVMTDDIPL